MLAADDEAEPMEVECPIVESESQQPAAAAKEPDEVDQPFSAQMTSSQEKDTAQVTINFKWAKGYQPQKPKVELEKIIQTWGNRNKPSINFSVLSVSEDGNAVIRIKPSSALGELHSMLGETLERQGKSATVLSLSMTVPGEKTQNLDNASRNLLSSVPELQHELVQQDKQNGYCSSATDNAVEKDKQTCLLPVSLFWYVSHIYKEEIQRIEKDNGVEIGAEVMVTLKPHQNDQDLNKAYSEFTSLVQNSFGESNGSAFSLKYVDPEGWRDALKIIQKKDSKVILTMFSEEMTVCGPRQSQDAIDKFLNAKQNTSTSAEESTWLSQNSSLKMATSIKDPLVDEGITMEEIYWKLITASFSEKIAKIKANFDVNLKVSDKGQGKLDISIHSRRGCASMQSHAARALLRLYQSIRTSSLSFTQCNGARGFDGSLKNNNYQLEGASSGPVSKREPEKSWSNTEAPTGDDENCPVCLEKFANKKRLHCKHEFCEQCLEKSKKSLGPICPVCRDVFGIMEGDQPDGAMSWIRSSSSLPGFSGCGSIQIIYTIHSGIQTKKHPKPGQPYQGVYRQAYLPDTKEGEKVLQLLQRAFEQKLIFTIGTSRTTGCENQVTWNDIHHKTSISGGPECFGYPDPGYLSRVQEELKAKGIK